MKSLLTFFTVLLASTVSKAELTADFSTPVGSVKRALHSSTLIPALQGRDSSQDADVRALNLAGAYNANFARENGNQRVVDMTFVYPLQSLPASDETSYVFGPTDESVNIAKGCGLDLVYRLGVTSDDTDDGHFNSRLPEDFDQTAEAMATVVRRYQSKVKAWEIWNAPDETDRNWWQDGLSSSQLRDRFAEFFATVLKRLRDEFGTSVKLGGPSLSAFDPDYLAAVLDACERKGVMPDFVSYKAFSGDLDEIVAGPQRVRDWLDNRGCPSVKVCLTEWRAMPAGVGEYPSLDLADLDATCHGANGLMTMAGAARTLNVLSRLQYTPLDEAYLKMSAVPNVWSWTDWNSYSGAFNPSYYALQLFGQALTGFDRLAGVQGQGEATSALALMNADGTKGGLLVTGTVDDGADLVVRLDGVRSATLTQAFALAADGVKAVSAGVSVASDKVVVSRSSVGPAACLVLFDLVPGQSTANSWVSQASVSKTSWTVGEAAGEITAPVPAKGTATATIARNGEQAAVWTGAMPTEPGRYVVAWTVAAGADYAEISTSVSFEILKAQGGDEDKEVYSPTIASATWNGQTQVASVPANAGYTVKANAGGTDVGIYDVVLALNEGYVWADGSKADKTLSFAIVQAANAWTTAPAISKASWKEGEAAGAFTAGVAKYGPDTMTVTLNGKAFDGTLPTAAGTYSLVCTVPESLNWKALSATVAFTIRSAATTTATPYVRFTITKKYPTQSTYDNAGIALSRFALYDEDGKLLNADLLKVARTAPLTAGTFWFESNGWSRDTDTSCANVFKTPLGSKMYVQNNTTAGAALEAGNPDYHVVFTMRLADDAAPVKYNLAVNDVMVMTSSLAGRYPTSWKVETSADGQTWTVVSEQSDIVPPKSANSWYAAGGSGDTPTEFYSFDVLPPEPPAEELPTVEGLADDAIKTGDDLLAAATSASKVTVPSGWTLAGNALKNAKGETFATFAAYYDVELTEKRLTLALNEKALPELAESSDLSDADQIFFVSAAEVGLRVKSTDSRLWYGLSSAAELGGSFEPPAPETLVQGVPATVLELNAAKNGTGGFYRIFVTDIAPARD